MCDQSSCTVTEMKRERLDMKLKAVFLKHPWLIWCYSERNNYWTVTVPNTPIKSSSLINLSVNRLPWWRLWTEYSFCVIYFILLISRCIHIEAIWFSSQIIFFPVERLRLFMTRTTGLDHSSMNSTDSLEVVLAWRRMCLCVQMELLEVRRAQEEEEKRRQPPPTEAQPGDAAAQPRWECDFVVKVCDSWSEKTRDDLLPLSFMTVRCQQYFQSLYLSLRSYIQVKVKITHSLEEKVHDLM